MNQTARFSARGKHKTKLIVQPLHLNGELLSSLTHHRSEGKDADFSEDECGNACEL